MIASTGSPTSSSSTVYHEDLVRSSVREQHSEVGVVLKTFHEQEEEDDLFGEDDDLSQSPSRPLRAGEVTIGFWPSGATKIMAENQLEVLDRALQIGDAVKRSPSSTLAGIVLNVEMELVLLHTPSAQRIGAISDPSDSIGSTMSSPTSPEIIKSSQVTSARRFIAGDHVVFNDWIGCIEDVFDEAMAKTDSRMVKLCDIGGVLNVETQVAPERLGHVKEMIHELDTGRIPAASATLPPSLQHTKYPSLTPSSANPQTGDTDVSQPDSFSSRIVDVRQTVVCVNWLGINQKLNPATQAFKKRPPRFFVGPELSSLVLIRKSEEGTHVVGDRVVFKQECEQSSLKRFGIQRSEMTDNDHDEVFIIAETSTVVEVLWQDGTKSTEASKSLVPYLNLDEFDVWPGDFVLWGSAEDQGGKSRLGVVQSMDPEERTARIRWYGTEDEVVLPVLELDLNGNAIEPISFGIHRGDEVMISDKSNGLALPNVGRIGDVEDLDEEFIRDKLVSLGMGLARESSILTKRYRPKELINSGNDDGDDDLDWPREGHGIDWVGFVVDLDLRGNIKVRLPSGTTIWQTIDSLCLLMDGFEDDWSENDADSDSDEWESDGDEETEKRQVEKAMSMFMNGLDQDHKDEWEDFEETEQQEGDNIMNDPNSNEAASTSSSTQALPAPIPLTIASELSNVDLCVDFPTFDPRWSRFEVLESIPSDHFYLATTYSPPSKSFFSRISKEFKILKSSLPDSILVRSFETRSDLLRVLIIGSEGTPYENAPFLIDFHLENYPFQPPKAYFHSWTAGNGRISPNLYEDGKVCLSLIGTWSGSEGESWSPTKSSLLQIFVSLQSLVLVPEPYYTEPSFEKLKLTHEGRTNSRLYSEKAFVLARSFVRRSLEKGVGGLNTEIKFFYLGDRAVGYGGRLERVLKRSYELIEKSEKLKLLSKEKKAGSEVAAKSTHLVEMQDRPIGRLSSGGTIVLKRTLTALEKLMK